ncbi:MAG: thermonuclease family protein [Ghiorsea sp.]
MLFRLSLIAAVFLCSFQAWPGTLSWVTHERWVTVQKVLDGDTFKTMQGEKIRLLNINTPEIQHDTSPAQPFGYQAKAALQNLIAGKQVRLTFDKEKKDKYKRTLAHVYLRDGLWVNAELVRLGFAHVYTFVPNIKAAKALFAIEREAISNRLNMWSDKRWRVLNPKELSPKILGQFRLINGALTKDSNNSWRVQLGKLAVTVPKKYRRGFTQGLNFNKGDEVLVRGRLRKSRKGQWFLSVHTPTDIVLFK